MATKHQNIKKLGMIADQASAHAKRAALSCIFFCEGITPQKTRGFVLGGTYHPADIVDLVRHVAYKHPREFEQAIDGIRQQVEEGQAALKAFEQNQPVVSDTPAAGEGDLGNDPVDPAPAVGDDNAVHPA